MKDIPDSKYKHIDKGLYWDAVKCAKVTSIYDFEGHIHYTCSKWIDQWLVHYRMKVYIDGAKQYYTKYVTIKEAFDVLISKGY